MIAQYERHITEEASKKALGLLKKLGNHLPQVGNGIYTYFLTIRNSTKNDLSLDALISVNDDKLVVLAVWEMIHSAEMGMLAAKNIDGEKGAYGAELAQKYANAFLTVAENVDFVK